MLVIPAIDLIDGKCVRLFQGDYARMTTYAREPVEQALKFQAAGFRRIHVIDLEGARAGEGRNREAIRRVVAACRVPVQVGGGVRQTEDVEQLLEAGVSRVIVGTVALQQPEKVTEWVSRWGAERFIVSLDLRAGKLQIEGWLQESPRKLGAALHQIADWGSRELICTDVEKDGTLEQPGFATYQSILAEFQGQIDLIAAGGITSPAHVLKLDQIGVAGAVVGRALYEGVYSWAEFVRPGRD